MNFDSIKAKIFEAVKFDGGCSLLTAANQCLQNPVALVDCSYHSLFARKQEPFDGYDAWLKRACIVLEQSVHSTERIICSNGASWMIRPIIVQSILIGYVVVGDLFQPFREEDQLLIDCISNAAALQCGLFSQMIQIPDISPHSHRMLFDDLLDMQIPHSNDLEHRLREIQWTACQGLYVMNVALRDVPYSAQFPMIQSSISQQINQVVPVYTYTYHFNQLVLLLCFGNVREPAMTDAQTKSLDIILKNMNLYAGISRRMDRLIDANEAFAQAQMAVEMPKKLNLEGHFHTYDSVALYHMIQISQSKIRDYHTFIHRAIPILQKYDMENRQELLYTLYIYLCTAQKALPSAQRLCIHKNTLFYRLKKIRTLTGIDLERSDEILHLQMSFLILQYDGYTFSEGHF